MRGDFWVAEQFRLFLPRKESRICAHTLAEETDLAATKGRVCVGIAQRGHDILPFRFTRANGRFGPDKRFACTTVTVALAVHHDIVANVMQVLNHGQKLDILVRCTNHSCLWISKRTFTGTLPIGR